MSEKNASDVYLSANTPILIKINGQILQLSDQPLSHTQPRQLLAELLTPQQLEELDDTGELNVGVGIAKVGSFRLSAFRQRGSIAAVFRCIPFIIPTMDTLGVPKILSELVLEKRGLILMVGATGTGKSTTLASMLEHRNQRLTGHILTIEDPIEFLFSNKKSVVNQREVGRDTNSLQIALKNALRQAPDCILIGEIRDRETMTSRDLVLAFGPPRAGHHARQQQLPRSRAGFFPSTRPSRGPHCCRTWPRACAPSSASAWCAPTAGGRRPTAEVLLNTKLVAELIEQSDLSGVKEAMEKSLAEGSQTFEEDLARLINEGVITREEGLAFADSPTNLLWRLANQSDTPTSRQPPKPEEPDPASFSEIILDVRPEESKSVRPTSVGSFSARSRSERARDAKSRRHEQSTFTWPKR